MQGSKQYFIESYEWLVKNTDIYTIYSKRNQLNYFKGIDLKNKKILDYGCGLGNNIYNIKSAVGFDVDNFAIEFAKTKGVKIIDKPKEDYYDIILCSHVLEHVKYPVDLLNKLSTYLNTNGILIIVIPHEFDEFTLIPDTYKYPHLHTWCCKNLTNLTTRHTDLIPTHCNKIYTGMYYNILKKLYILHFKPMEYYTSIFKRLLSMNEYNEFRLIFKKSSISR